MLYGQKTEQRQIRNARLAQPVPVQRLYLTTKEAMAYLGCKRDMLESLREQGAVRCSKIGNTCYWRLQDIDDALEKSCVNTFLHQCWKREHR